MKMISRTNVIVAGFCLGATLAAGPAAAQAPPTEVKYVTIDGEVVRYEAGSLIVIRGADNKETVYTLSPGLVVPAEVKVGRRVTLFTEPGRDGTTQLVSRVTTTSVTPSGDVKRTTEDTRVLPSGATSRTTTVTTTSGKVQAYVAGKTLTLLRADGSRVTYLIDAKSAVPADLTIGKEVTIVPMVTAGSTEPVAQTITYVVTTTPPQP